LRKGPDLQGFFAFRGRGEKGLKRGPAENRGRMLAVHATVLQSNCSWKMPTGSTGRKTDLTR